MAKISSFLQRIRGVAPLRTRRGENFSSFSQSSVPSPQSFPLSALSAPLRLIGFLLLFLLSSPAQAAETIPPVPAQYFNDYAHVVSPSTVQQLNKTLENFERQTSNQILVVIYPKMLSDSSIEDYTVRVAQSWHVGQKGRDNGAVLFVFIQDRTMYLQVGYGLEGALPDATAKQIIDTIITPAFRQGNFDAGLTAGVNAILAATRGEYKGTGRTVSDRLAPNNTPIPFGCCFFSLLLFFFLFSFLFGKRRGRYYSSTGPSTYWGPSSWSGGGSFGGGGGGFSSGGGSFGGGGAGGRW